MKYVMIGSAVFAYDDEQQDLYDEAIAAGGIDITGQWPPDDTLDFAKDAKRDEIRILFESEANANIPAIGTSWQGGIDSALKLDAAKRLAEAVGATTVEFFDAADIGHDLDMADATAVTIAVGVAYQTALAKKKAAFRAIEAATSQADIDAITWSTP